MTLEQAVAHALSEEVPDRSVVAPNAAAPAPACPPPHRPEDQPASAEPPGAVPPPDAHPGAGGPAAAPGGLTPREWDVAVLVARGLTNRQIAAALVIAPTTAARHVEHILAKLGLHSRAQIGAWAAEHGLLAADPD
jgi:DNA-binding NarL/FixJ family response regulator